MCFCIVKEKDNLRGLLFEASKSNLNASTTERTSRGMSASRLFPCDRASRRPTGSRCSTCELKGREVPNLLICSSVFWLTPPVLPGDHVAKPPGVDTTNTSRGTLYKAWHNLEEQLLRIRGLQVWNTSKDTSNNVSRLGLWTKWR